ncbi:hypothetical protein [Streptomyces sp. NPDC003480]
MGDDEGDRFSDAILNEAEQQAAPTHAVAVLRAEGKAGGADQDGHAR